MAKRLFTSESVTEGHPDKMCDQIADAILDELLSHDKAARVACEVMATTGVVFIMGEITTNTYVDLEAITRKTVREIGYCDAKYGFDCDACAVVTTVKGQSPDIAMGVDKALEARRGDADEDETGAGDQGMMFGYACDETEELMPLPLSLSHKLAKGLAALRHGGELPYLRPDGKSQVTVEYEDDKPVAVTAVVISTQHDPDVPHATIERDMIDKLIKQVIPAELLTAETKFYINPTGRFVIGGPQGDSGLTGRKIIVDTYGGVCGHGGGSFSGKDPTKVDRSAAYMARYVAKNIVAAGLAARCELQLAYAIGVSQPVSVVVNTHGTGKMSDEAITKLVRDTFDFRPASIIKLFDLRRPIYKQTAAYGHFGRSEDTFPWEKTDKAAELRKAAGQRPA